MLDPREKEQDEEKASKPNDIESDKEAFHLLSLLTCKTSREDAFCRHTSPDENMINQ